MCSHNVNDAQGTAPTDGREKCSGLLTSGAARRGMGNLVYCLSKQAMVCDHAVHFGDSHYCLHPLNQEFTGRFKAYSQESLPGKSS